MSLKVIETPAWDEALVWDDRIARLDTREAVRLTLVEVVA